MKNSVAITGAGSGIGEALADTLGHQGDCSLHLIGGRRAEKLEEVGKRTRAAEVVPGDLFVPGSMPYQALMATRAKIIAHIAAINVDMHQPEAEREPLSAAQTALLEALIDVLKKNDPDNPRLLVDVNSVMKFAAEENVPRVGQLPYPQMKMRQAKILSDARGDLRNAGVELLVAFPAAIRTEMLRHLPEDDKAVRMANLVGRRLKTVPDHPNGLEQDRIFQPGEVAAALAHAINSFLVNGEIPEDKREWIMSHSGELNFA